MFACDCTSNSQSYYLITTLQYSQLLTNLKKTPSIEDTLTIVDTALTQSQMCLLYNCYNKVHQNKRQNSWNKVSVTLKKFTIQLESKDSSLCFTVCALFLQIHKLKQDQKKETGKIQDCLANIRTLRALQDQKIREIESDKKELATQVERISMERDAFIGDNQRISQLVQSAGLRQYKNVSPGEMVKYLIKEIQKSQTEAKTAQEELNSKQRDLETSMHQARKRTNQLEKELASSQELHEDLVKKLQADKDKLEATCQTLQEKEAAFRSEIKDLKKKVVQETDEIKGRFLTDSTTLVVVIYRCLHLIIM